MMMKILIILFFLLGLLNGSSEEIKIMGDSNRIIVKLSEQVPVIELEKRWSAKRVKRFFPNGTGYFSTLYEVLPGEMKANQIAEDSLVASVEKPHLIQIFEVQPNGSPYLTQDSFSNYQWALREGSHYITRDQDDIHPEVRDVVRNSGLAWDKKEIERIEKRMRKNPIVAVLDGGVDVDHEDLQGSFFRNDVECEENGRPQIGDAEDRDENGFLGDCLGWDFTMGDSPFARHVKDEVGHGTHIAGILSAKRGNSIGIAGFSDRIQILPVKVYGNLESQRLEGTVGPVTDRVAKGILYAVQRGVDVIVLSMGWPNSRDSQFLREAFAQAYSKGISIVAAAGNDSSDTPLFPCSYKEVICVGSHNIDNKMSEFSNYGNHVDFSAPGDNILSTYPSGVQQSHFGPSGYEILSGTSFSAPYVAAMVALKKGVDPSSGPLEIYNALKKASHPIVVGKKRILVGAPKLSHFLLEEEERSENKVIPSFKDINRIVVDGDGRFEIRVQLKNLSRLVQTVQIEFSSNSDLISMEKPEVLQLASNSEVEVPLFGVVRDFEIESQQMFSVKIVGDVREYVFRVHLIQRVETDRVKEIDLPIAYVDKKGKNFSTVNHFPNPTHTPDYVFTTQADRRDPILLHRFLVKLEHDKEPLTLERTYKLRKKESILSYTAMDLNYDGVEDFLLRTMIRSGTKSQVFYHYLNEDLEPLFDSSVLELIYEGALLPANPRSQRFIKLSLPSGKPIAVPFVLDKGTIPQADRDPDFFSFEENYELLRAYYFEPVVREDGKLQLRTRIYRNYKLNRILKERLGYRFESSLKIQSLFPQTELQFSDGTVDVLWSYGNGDIKSYYMSRVGEGELKESRVVLNDFDSKHQNFDRNVIANVTSATEVDYYSEVNTFFSVYRSNLARISLFDRTGLIESKKIEQEELSDSIGKLLQVFETKNGYLLFYESQNGLQSIEIEESEAFYSTYSVERTSFYPGYFFSQNFYPLRVKVRDRFAASIYVDNTQMTGKHLALLTYDLEKGMLSSPIRMNFEVPRGCISRNPVFPKNSGIHYTLFCEVEGTLKFIPVDVDSDPR